MGNGEALMTVLVSVSKIRSGRGSPPAAAEFALKIIKAAPLRGTAPGVRARLSLDEARLAHAGPHLPAPLISKAHPGRSSVLHSRLPGA